MNNWTEEMHNKWIDVSSKWIGLKAIEDNPKGLKDASEMVTNWMEQIGFEIETYVDDDAPYRPVIVAKKPPIHGNKWIGFFHHYDVEPADDNEWSSDPWNAKLSNGLLYGRGIADNIGPFTQRLICIEEQKPDVGLLFVIQGEEEIGSPWAHEIYPKLALPDVEFWIDETGYFFKNGDQRILYVGQNETIDRINHIISETNLEYGIETKVRNRVMSKAFGENKCPCIAHLQKGKPYLAIGPNDDSVRVHGVDEALNTSLLALSAKHLEIIFQEVA